MQINLSDTQNVGQNVQAGTVTDGGKTYLVLLLDVNKDLGPSSSGKMRGVANTNGFTALPGSLKGNVYIGKMAR